MRLKAHLIGGSAVVALATTLFSTAGCAWPEFPPRSALPRPEALDREPYRRVKRHFRTWDIKDPVAMKRLAEAADSLAAFRIAFYCAPSLCPPPLKEPIETLIAPGAESRLRRLQLSEQAKKASSGLNVGYGFFAIGTNRLAFLAEARFIADPLANYTDGFVFERQSSGKWQFVCHLSGFPRPSAPSNERLNDGYPPPAPLPPGTVPLC